MKRTKRFSWTNRERAKRLRLNFHVYLRMRRSLAGKNELRRLNTERTFDTLDLAIKIIYPSNADVLAYESCQMFIMDPQP